MFPLTPQQPGTFVGPAGTHNFPGSASTGLPGSASTGLPGSASTGLPGSASTGLWGSMASPGAGLMGNPLFMGGLSLLSGSGAGSGMLAAQQAQQNAWSRQMQMLQLQRLQEDTVRQREQERRLANLAGNPKLGVDPDIWAALGPSVQAQVAASLFEPAGERRIIKDAAGFQRYADTRERVFPDVKAPPLEPTTAERNLEAAGYKRGTPEYAAAMRDYMMKSQVTIQQGTGAAEPTVITGPDAAARNLNPERLYQLKKDGSGYQDIGAAQTAMSGEASRQAAMAATGLTDVNAALDAFAPVDPGTGERQFDRSAWLLSKVPQREERDARLALERAIANQLRLKTGAAQTEAETMMEEGQYLPNAAFDSDRGAVAKMERIREFLTTSRDNIDPQVAQDFLAGKRATLGDEDDIPPVPPGATVTEEVWP